MSDVASFRVIPERSTLWAEATSSVHPVRVETDGFEGLIQATIITSQDGAARTVELAAGTRVELAATRLKSGHGLVDRELEKRIDVRRFPTVSGEVRGASAIAPGSVRLSGDLTFYGVTRSVAVVVNVRAIDHRTVEIEGEYALDMREFGLDPPRILFLKVHPVVKVRARVVGELIA